MNHKLLRMLTSAAIELCDEGRSNRPHTRTTLGLVIAGLCVLAALPAVADWHLDTAHSSLSFATTKNLAVGEGHGFSQLDGGVDAAGQARLTVDLASVDTGIDIRNQRIRDLLFDVVRFPQAEVRADVPLPELAALAVGASVLLPLDLHLRLHGLEGTLSTNVRVRRLAADRVEVSSVRPILVNAASFDLLPGLEKLRELAGLQSISPAVPVWLQLEFRSE